MTHWAKVTLLACLAFMAPIQPLLVGALVATGFDTLTGIMAARKRGERISSAGFRRTISKGLVYSMAIICAYVVEKTLLPDMIPVAKLAAAAIGITELKSVLENVSTVLGMPVFQALMNKLGSANDPLKAKGAEPEEKT